MLGQEEVKSKEILKLVNQNADYSSFNSNHKFSNQNVWVYLRKHFIFCWNTAEFKIIHWSLSKVSFSEGLGKS